MGMKHVIFDWGDTIMRDDPGRTEPMCLWPHVELVAGAKEVLSALSRTAQIHLATNAAASDEAMIRQALARVEVDSYFQAIFTAKSFGFKKSAPEFWVRVLKELKAKADDVMVVGDSFEADVAAPSSLGLRAVWLNVRSKEERSGERYRTIHDLAELLSM